MRKEREDRGERGERGRSEGESSSPLLAQE